MHTPKSQKGCASLFCIKNRILMNDAYCRDISIKIRSHLEIKRKNGEFIGSFPVYGYMKDPKDRHKLLIDEYAADTVRDIFRMKLQGMSQEGIAKYLNEHDVLSPADYKASCGMNYHTSFKMKPHSEWTAVTVRRILNDEVCPEWFGDSFV